jgi:hypothetical protein
VFGQERAEVLLCRATQFLTEATAVPIAARFFGMGCLQEGQHDFFSFAAERFPFDEGKLDRFGPDEFGTLVESFIFT